MAHLLSIPWLLTSAISRWLRWDNNLNTLTGDGRIVAASPTNISIFWAASPNFFLQRDGFLFDD